jgi:hypothetical protein
VVFTRAISPYYHLAGEILLHGSVHARDSIEALGHPVRKRHVACAGSQTLQVAFRYRSEQLH